MNEHDFEIAQRLPLVAMKIWPHFHIWERLWDIATHCTFLHDDKRRWHTMAPSTSKGWINWSLFLELVLHWECFCISRENAKLVKQPPCSRWQSGPHRPSLTTKNLERLWTFMYKGKGNIPCSKTDADQFTFHPTTDWETFVNSHILNLYHF